MFHPVFWKIHQALPREGPGDNASTGRAFSMLRDLPNCPEILDIGCGPGMQTLTLAKLSGGCIMALDFHQPFLDALNRKARRLGMADRITTINGSMLEMNFPECSFDVIWSEGSIFIIGFTRGLSEWKKFLKPGGYLAVTEACWLKNNPSPEIKQYWQSVYPAIMNIEGNLREIQKAGWLEIGHFVLPASSWWDYYYKPIIKRLNKLKPVYAGDQEALAVLSEHELEIEMFQKYSNYYSYVFFVMRKPGENSEIDP